MKIVQAAGWFFPQSTGGTEVYVDALSRALVRAGHDVRVASPKSGGGLERGEWNGLPVVRYPVSDPPSPEEVAGLKPSAGIEQFQAFLEAERPDVVHFHSWTRGCGRWHIKAARPLAGKLFLTVHTTLCPRGTMMRWGTRTCDGQVRPFRCAACVFQKRGLPAFLAASASALSALAGRPGPGAGSSTVPNLRRLGREMDEVWAAVDGVVSLCEWGREALRRNRCPESKLVLSRQGLSRLPAGPTVGPSGGPLRIGYVGRLDPIKGIDVLIRAFRMLPADADAALEIHGMTQGAEGDAHLETLRRLAGGDPRIRFGGQVAHELVPGLMSSFDLLAVPSVCLETGPLVVMEAQACGVPVLGSNLGGIAERVRDGVDGWLAAAGDARDWSAILRRALGDRRALSEMRNRAPRAKTMDEVAGEMMRMYGCNTK